MGDLDHLWMRLFRTNRDLPKSLPSRAGAIRAFLDAWRLPDVRDETFRGDDLRPAVFELRQYVKNLTGSGIHRLGKALRQVPGVTAAVGVRNDQARFLGKRRQLTAVDPHASEVFNLNWQQGSRACQARVRPLRPPRARGGS